MKKRLIVVLLTAALVMSIPVSVAAGPDGPPGIRPRNDTVCLRIPTPVCPDDSADLCATDHCSDD